MNGGRISAVEPGSLGARLGLRPGDLLLEINGHSLRDVLDVQYYAAEERLKLRVQREGRERLYQVEREYGVPLGLDFDAPTFDGIRECGNRCEFCFVSQMPPRSLANVHGAPLRRSLYVRDDDYRYSVLYGSFITLTNLTEEDWARLEEQRLSPLYLSVHATEPALRGSLLGRADIPEILPQIDRLAALGIEMHTQIVLIPGRNDGRRLRRTIADLAGRYPSVRSIGVVPVGLTRYHRGSCRAYRPEEARRIIAELAPLQAAYRAQYGVSLLYLADEWYLLAGRQVPEDAWYDGYPQIENGIGLVRQFLEDSRALDASTCPPTSGTLVCGTLIASLMERAVSEWAAEGRARIDVVPVVNQLFGETVTVSGLLGGAEVLAELRKRELGERVYLPRSMFAQPAQGAPPLGQDQEAALRTLDDLTVDELQEALGCPVVLGDLLSDLCVPASRTVFGEGAGRER